MEELLNILLEKEDKSIIVKEKFIVKKIEMKNEIDLIILDLQKNSNLYKGLAMEKGNIFPIPKLDDVLSVEKMYLKYDGEFLLKLYLEGKILKDEQLYLKESIINIYDYSEIFKILASIKKKNICKINSSIFIIIYINDNKIGVKALNNSKIYYIDLNTLNKKVGDFLWIYYYEIKEDKIIINNLSVLETLNEERLLHLLENCIFENINLFHIVEIDDEKYILINSSGKLFYLNKKKNINYIKNYNFDFCITIILSNITIESGDSIELNQFSFIYKFKEESYYIENILINSYAVIQFNFLDFQKNNFYDYIYTDKQDYFIIKEIDENLIEKNKKEEENKLKEDFIIEEKINEKSKEKKKELKDQITKRMKEELTKLEENIKKRKEIFSLKISEKIKYLTISCTTFKKYEYFPFNITLNNSKEENSITFTVYLFPGLMNKINVFVNHVHTKAYFYEFLYYNISDNLKDVSKNINVDGKEYKINKSDSFGSKNRKRICIMNIPYQKNEVDEDELNGNSFQICELIKDEIHKIVGIFDISYNNFDIENSNDFFDNYYSEFGDVYDLITIYKGENAALLNEKIKKFKNLKFKNDFFLASEFVDLMTLSQFKTRAGLIICQFMNNAGKFMINSIIKQILDMYNLIKDENLSYSEIIRILVYTLENYNNSSKIKLQFVSKLKNNSPYLIAYKFNKEQINNLHEFSPLFQAYLQLDSYKAYNYIHQNDSHSFSMELIFMMKYQLLSTYEQFFYIINEQNDEYAHLDNKTKITVLNQLTIFGENFDEDDITNTEMVYNYAMPISIHFLHEKSGHYKYLLKNRYSRPPLFYFKGFKIKVKIDYFEGNFVGESGLIIQDFICDDEKIINELLTNFIYGNLLKKKYFGERDFKNLNEAVKKQIEENKIKSKNSNVNSPGSSYNRVKSPPKFNNSIKHSDVKYSLNGFKKPTNEEKMIRLRIIYEYREKIFQEKKKKLEKLNHA